VEFAIGPTTSLKKRSPGKVEGLSHPDLLHTVN